MRVAGHAAFWCVLRPVVGLLRLGRGADCPLERRRLRAGVGDTRRAMTVRYGMV